MQITNVMLRRVIKMALVRGKGTDIYICVYIQSGTLKTATRFRIKMSFKLFYWNFSCNDYVDEK